jgi:hypothetical protein
MADNGRVADRTDAVDDAARALYAVAPEEFMARRGELAAQARADGDSDAARAIEKLRKPTVAAWIVNAFALDDPSVIDQLSELGDRLRAAQHALDAARLRELSTERRTLISTLTRNAMKRTGRSSVGAGLRDEVSGTFEAALADPGVAGRLGRLQRSEQWSGFGFAASGAPELTLVQGGRGDRVRSRSQPADEETVEGAGRPADKAPPKRTAAEKRRVERALARARQDFETAEAAFDEARGSEQDLSQEVRRLTKKLAKLQNQLDIARVDLENARKDVTSTRTARREARSALDRAERAATD